MRAVFALLLSFAAVAFCTTGVDVSAAIPASDFSCLSQKGFTYAIIRCFRDVGSVDPNCVSNVKNAQSAGMEVGVYVFPCPKCKLSAAAQINETVSLLSQNGIKYDTMWLDVEQTEYWTTQSANQAFFTEMVNAAVDAGVNLGVYTSSSQWAPIMGSFTGGSKYPLWYAHYNNIQSFSDFTPFGGWSSPAMKQYQGNQNVCGAGVDLNYSPGGSTSSSSNSGNSGNGNSGNSGNSATSASGNSGNGNSGTSASGNSGNGNSGTSASGNSGNGNSGTSASGNGNSGNGNGNSGNSGHSGNSGNSGNGNSGNGNSGNGNSNSNSNSGYSSGSSGSGSGVNFISENAIYSKIGGGKQQAMVVNDRKSARTKNKNKVDLLIQNDMDDISSLNTKENHFQVLEEKSAKKFF